MAVTLLITAFLVGPTLTEFWWVSLCHDSSSVMWRKWTLWENHFPLVIDQVLFYLKVDLWAKLIVNYFRLYRLWQLWGRAFFSPSMPRGLIKVNWNIIYINCFIGIQFFLLLEFWYNIYIFSKKHWHKTQSGMLTMKTKQEK